MGHRLFEAEFFDEEILNDLVVIVSVIVPGLPAREEPGEMVKSGIIMYNIPMFKNIALSFLGVHHIVSNGLC